MYAVLNSGSSVFRSACGTSRRVLGSAAAPVAAAMATSAAAPSRLSRFIIVVPPCMAAGRAAENGSGGQGPLRARDLGVGQGVVVLRDGARRLDVDDAPGDLRIRRVEVLRGLHDDQLAAGQVHAELGEQVGAH